MEALENKLGYNRSIVIGLITGLVKLLENGGAEDFNSLRKEFNQQNIR
jgi:hypothetical protein